MKLFGKHLICLTILLFVVSASCKANEIITENSINIERIRQLFERMEAQGVDLTKPHLYGYFFFDEERSSLQRLSEEVLKDGYKLVNLEQIEESGFRLHIEKVETHTPESLFHRGLAFTKIATKYSVDVYDGWDVGNADPSKPLVTNESFREFMNAKSGEDRFTLGEKLLDLEIYDRAEQVFRNCIDQRIKEQDSTHNLSFALLEQNKTDEAISLLEEAVKKFPNHLKMRFNLAATYYELGSFEKTIEHYQVAARLSPSDANIVYGIAAAQFGLGKFSDSLINCKRALALDPDHEYAKALLKQLGERK